MLRSNCNWDYDQKGQKQKLMWESSYCENTRRVLIMIQAWYCEGQHCYRTFIFNHLVLIYCIAGKFGGEFNLQVQRIYAMSAWKRDVLEHSSASIFALWHLDRTIDNRALLSMIDLWLQLSQCIHFGENCTSKVLVHFGTIMCSRFCTLATNSQSHKQFPAYSIPDHITYAHRSKAHD